MSALYNDTEHFACDWLQHLMDAGLILPGKIDDRSIADLSPDDLAGFERVHLFAGIGGWDRALQLAGWREGPVWTCSCPCPPFSQAGKRQSCRQCASGNLVWCPRRTGYCLCADCGHAWLADGRHLWPEAWRLIARCRPPVVFGEQVASLDGLEWLAGVRASLEILSYAPWGTDYPAAGVGSPNIRQRIWWLADRDAAGRIIVAQRDGRTDGRPEVQQRHYADGRGGHGANGVAHATAARHDGSQEAGADRGRAGSSGAENERRQAGFQQSQRGGAAGRLADAPEPRRGEQPGRHGGADGRPAPQSGRLRDAGVVGDTCSERLPLGSLSDDRRRALWRERTATAAAGLHGFWSDFDIVHCTDGKARRVPQSSILRLVDGLPDGVVRGSLEGAEGFPLAEGADNRVGRLKGYGNSVNPYAAARIIRAWRDVRNA